MPKSLFGTKLLELTNPGQRVIIDTGMIDKMGIAASNYDTMGTAVVEVVKMIGSVDISYDPAKLISLSSQSVEPFDVDGISKVGLVTITEDAVPDLAIVYYGEETQ